MSTTTPDRQQAQADSSAVALAAPDRRQPRGVQAPARAAVIAQAAAREIGVRAHLAGENAFTFGLLAERADDDAAARQDRARRAWKRAKRPKSLG